MYKNFTKKNTILQVLLLILFYNLSFSQLHINKENTVEDLVTKEFLKNNTTIWVDSIVYHGQQKALGQFNLKLQFNSLPKSGIILSTGDIMDAIGPNYNMPVNNLPFKTQPETDPFLSKIASGPIYNIAALGFNFITCTDSIQFNFFFASEEYPEFVKKNVNDVFGFFLTEIQTGQTCNIAVLNDGKTPISIDNINSNKNCEFYIPNGFWNKDDVLQWKDYKPMGELAYIFSYDGFSKKITVGNHIKPNKLYRLNLIIADVGDDLFDSAVFLEAHTFKSSGKTDKSLPIDPIANIFDNDSLTISDSAISVYLPIYFAFDSDSIQRKNSYKLLSNILAVMHYDTSLMLEVTGHTDSKGTKKYNETLSLNRAKAIAAYLVKRGVDANKIKTAGAGYSKLKSNTKNELNRRVEFKFFK